MSVVEEERIKQMLSQTLETISAKDTAIHIETVVNDTLLSVRLNYNYFGDSIANISKQSTINENIATFINQIFPPDYQQIDSIFAELLHQDYPDMQSAVELTNLTGDTVINIVSAGNVTVNPKYLRTTVQPLDIYANTGIRGVIVPPQRTFPVRTSFAWILSLLFTGLALGCTGFFIYSIYPKYKYTSPDTTCQPHPVNKTIVTTQQDSIFTIGKYKYNSKAFRLLLPNGEELKLTNAQGLILQQLCAHLGETVSREMLTEALFGKKTDVETRSIDTHISTLRKYLKEDISVEIRKCYGQGYRLIVGG
jgi:DNA-binding winged helix-turn-helix (wHTH) protein